MHQESYDKEVLKGNDELLTESRLPHILREKVFAQNPVASSARSSGRFTISTEKLRLYLDETNAGTQTISLYASAFVIFAGTGTYSSTVYQKVITLEVEGENTVTVNTCNIYTE